MKNLLQNQEENMVNEVSHNGKKLVIKDEFDVLAINGWESADPDVEKQSELEAICEIRPHFFRVANPCGGDHKEFFARTVKRMEKGYILEILRELKDENEESVFYYTIEGGFLGGIVNRVKNPRDYLLHRNDVAVGNENPEKFEKYKELADVCCKEILSCGVKSTTPSPGTIW